MSGKRRAKSSSRKGADKKKKQFNIMELLDQIYQDPKTLYGRIDLIEGIGEENNDTKAKRDEMRGYFLDLTLQSLEAWSKSPIDDIEDTESPSLIWKVLDEQNKQLIEESRSMDLAGGLDEEEEEYEIAEEDHQDAEEDTDDIPEEFKSMMKDEEEDFEEDATKGLEDMHSSDLEMNEEEDGMNEPLDIDLNAPIPKDGDEEGDNSNKPIRYEDLYGDEPPDAQTAKIREIEKALIEKKPWHLSGEATISDRPKDSLADIEFDFDTTSNLPPTPLQSSEIEAILLTRIEAMNFDDVVRKRKVTQTPSELYQINGQKPQKSLVEEYAEEFMKKASGQESEGPVLTEIQREALDLWRDLEHEINKFTEPRYIAKRPREKIDIVRNAVLDVEDHPEPVKAPEEVLAPVGSTRQLKSEAEQTHEEKKAERRFQKEKFQKKKDRKDAERGVLYSQSGKDGAEVQIENDVARLMKGQLAGIETFMPGEAISAEKKTTTDKAHKNILL